jgi:hypothetical protein
MHSFQNQSVSELLDEGHRHDHTTDHHTDHHYRPAPSITVHCRRGPSSVTAFVVAVAKTLQYPEIVVGMEKLRTELMGYKKAIESALADDNYEQLIDVMKILLDLSAPSKGQPPVISEEVIRATRIGSTIADVKKKYASALQSASEEVQCKVSESSKLLLVQFKRIVDANSHKQPIGVSKPSSSGTQNTTKQPTKSTAMHPHINEEGLSEHRRKIIDLLVEALNSDVSIQAPLNSSGRSSSSKRKTALDIEDAINKLHPYDGNSKQYGSKARTLVFNIKKNEVILIFSHSRNLIMTFLRN